MVPAMGSLPGPRQCTTRCMPELTGIAGKQPVPSGVTTHPAPVQSGYFGVGMTVPPASDLCFSRRATWRMMADPDSCAQAIGRRASDSRILRRKDTCRPNNSSLKSLQVWLK